MPNSEPARVSLEPCPFCGGEGLVHRTPGFGRLWRVSCKNCDASPSSSIGDDSSAAIAKWNTRTPPTSPGWQDYERGLEDAAKVAEAIGANPDWQSPIARETIRCASEEIATAIRALKSPAAPECGR